MVDCHYGSKPAVDTGNPVLTSPTGVCIVSGKLGMCQPPNPCGAASGVLSFTARSGHISDGYTLYPSPVSCEFRVDPIIPTPLRPYTALSVAVQRVDIGYVGTCGANAQAASYWLPQAAELRGCGCHQ